MAELHTSGAPESDLLRELVEASAKAKENRLNDYERTRQQQLMRFGDAYAYHREEERQERREAAELLNFEFCWLVAKVDEQAKEIAELHRKVVLLIGGRQ